jgi:hypothetical protein
VSTGKTRVTSAPAIDPFRARQVPDVAARFTRERDRQRRQADLMWLGTLTALFSDHDLRLLRDLGFLSQHDLDLLNQAGRGPGQGTP